MPRKSTHKSPKQIESLKHEGDKRKNIPTAEFQSIMADEELKPIQVAYGRRNPDLDPQLVWRGKDLLEWSDLVVNAPPLYIQEKVHPKVIIDDLVNSDQWLGRRVDSDEWIVDSEDSGLTTTHKPLFMALMSSIPSRARCELAIRMRSPAGSSTPTTTKKASSSATPISSVPATPTNPSKPPSKPKSTPTPGNPYMGTYRDCLISRDRAASPSKSSTTSAMR